MATSTTVVLLCFFLFLLPLSVCAATFEIVNGCSFTVWAAWTAMSPRDGGGDQLNPGQSWTINVTAGSAAGQICASTSSSIDGNSRGRCETCDWAALYSSPSTTGRCCGFRCAADSIVEECPAALRTPGGCTLHGVRDAGILLHRWAACGPTQYSRVFRERCPDAYVGIPSDQAATNDCPGGTNYRVTFCS